jgi:hypothetical protein
VSIDRQYAETMDVRHISHVHYIGVGASGARGGSKHVHSPSQGMYVGLTSAMAVHLFPWVTYQSLGRLDSSTVRPSPASDNKDAKKKIHE